jgi:hypothetical protein
MPEVTEEMAHQIQLQDQTHLTLEAAEVVAVPVVFKVVEALEVEEQVLILQEQQHQVQLILAVAVVVMEK